MTYHNGVLVRVVGRKTNELRPIAMRAARWTRADCMVEKGPKGTRASFESDVLSPSFALIAQTRLSFTKLTTLSPDTGSVSSGTLGRLK
jgi:hypothetical protein